MAVLPATMYAEKYLFSFLLRDIRVCRVLESSLVFKVVLRRDPAKMGSGKADHQTPLSEF